MNKITARNLRQMKDIVDQLKLAANGLDTSDYDTHEEVMEAIRILHEDWARRGDDALQSIQAVIEAYEEGYDIKSPVDISEIIQAKKWQRKQAKTGS